jgi:hypothetical protein
MVRMKEKKMRGQGLNNPFKIHSYVTGRQSTRPHLLNAHHIPITLWAGDQVFNT